MARPRRKPGEVRDAIIAYLGGQKSAHIRDIHAAVSKQLGDVPESSVRSYLNLNAGAGKTFQRTGRGTYKLRGRG